MIKYWYFCNILYNIIKIEFSFKNQNDFHKHCLLLTSEWSEKKRSNEILTKGRMSGMAEVDEAEVIVL